MRGDAEKALTYCLPTAIKERDDYLDFWTLTFLRQEIFNLCFSESQIQTDKVSPGEVQIKRVPLESGDGCRCSRF